MENETIKDQVEQEFAQSVLEENAELFERITDRVQQYAIEGRSDKLYLFVKAVNTIFQLGQRDMKKALGIDGARVN